jgi:putative transposase
MRKSRFTESQIVSILKDGEAGLPLAELVRKHGITRTTYFRWKAKYAGATVADLRRVKELEAENAKLKRMYADLALLSRFNPRAARRGWRRRRTASATFTFNSVGIASWAWEKASTLAPAVDGLSAHTGPLVGTAQPQVAHFKITITTTDRGAGLKMSCERGSHWNDLSFGCAPSRADCSAQVDESGVGNQRP